MKIKWKENRQSHTQERTLRFYVIWFLGYVHNRDHAMYRSGIHELYIVSSIKLLRPQLCHEF